MSRWQSRVFVLLGAMLGLALLGGLAVATSLTVGGTQAGSAGRPTVVSRG